MSELLPTKTLAIEVLSCTDTSRERDFNWWYDKVHIPDLRETPGIVDVYRYRDILPDFGELGASLMAPAGKPVRYLTLYRINSDDPWGLMQKIKEDDKKRAAEGKMMDCMETYDLTVWDFVSYRRTVSPLQRPETRLPDGMPEAMLLVFISAEPARILDHDEWWLYAHAHDLLETPGLVQCHRYRSLKPKPAGDDATHLHIYEIDSDDPAAVVLKILEDDRDLRKPQGRMISGTNRAQPYSRGVYRHWDIMCR